jgi:hypothetical protein
LSHNCHKNIKKYLLKNASSPTNTQSQWLRPMKYGMAPGAYFYKAKLSDRNTYNIEKPIEQA